MPSDILPMIRDIAIIVMAVMVTAAARSTGAKIFFADEAHFQADADLRGKWVLKEEPALVDSTSPRRGEKASYYSAVCLETGEVEVMELTGNSNAATATTFLRQLRARHIGPLTVIWDNSTAHRGASPVVHADETGGWEDGHNGYVWTFSTPTERYFLRRGRGKEVVDEALGDSFSGVLVRDFYDVYHHYDGPKQRCWDHLLRDIHDQRTLYPHDEQPARWADAVHRLYTQAKAFTHPQPRRRRTAQLALERRVLDICRPCLNDPSAAPSRLSRRIERHIRELFVFVAEPDVPADNAAAERSLCHLVISRKVSGGTRSERGTASKMTLASLFGTWRAPGLNCLASCRQLLRSPQL